jgi:radical SAM superfamily enzyme YgiQ (UPF0313 family)
MDAQWRDPNGTFFSVSYGIEKLRASIRSAPDLDDVEVLLLDLRSDDPDVFMAELETFGPTLIGLSTYIWSLPVFAALTERIRARWPSLPVVAGGPAARRSVLDLPLYQGLRNRLDAVVTGEGEEVIRALVREHQAPRWTSRVPGLEVPQHGLWRSSATIERPVIDDYPSPYQLDVGPLHKTGYIETFRGCPIHCAFCQWGEQKSDRVHGVDYLRAHLEGLQRANVPNVFFLDAAFNLSPRAFRALVAAENDVGVLKDSIVHGHLYPTYLEEHHLKFFDGVGQVQASVGIQSFDEDVLKRLGRPFDLAKFETVLERMRGRLDFDIELILGLPGDNPDSFKRTVEKSLELGDTVKAFKCIVLPDALLERADELHIDFDPADFITRSCDGWPARELEETWQWLYELASNADRPILNDGWVGFALTSSGPDKYKGRSDDTSPSVQSSGRVRSAGRADAGVVHRGIGAEILQTLRDEVSELGPMWRLNNARAGDAAVFYDLEGPDGGVVLEAKPAHGKPRCFLERDGIAYTHQGPVDRMSAVGLRRVIDVVHAHACASLLGPPPAMEGEALGERQRG